MRIVAQDQQGGPLTAELLKVQQELENLQDELRDVLRALEAGKERYINDALTAVATEIDPDRQAMMESIVEESLDSALANIHQARNLIGRLGTVTRNGIEMTRKAEKTWQEVLMSLVRDTRWFKEKFPALYEERRRKKEYERFRQRPEMYNIRPYRGYGLEERGPELQDVRVRSSLKIEKKAQLDHITAAVEGLFRRIFAVVQTYFSADSPILEAANYTINRVKSRLGRASDRVLSLGLKDQMQILENVFGFEKQPGRYVVSGGRAFLLPAAQKLQEALKVLHEPLQQIERTRSVEELLSQRLQPQQQQQQAPPGGTAPGSLLTSRMKRTLERLGRIQERQKRCHITQRIASSR